MVMRSNQVLGRGWAGFVTLCFLFSFMAIRYLMDTLEYDGYYYSHKALPIGIGVLGVLFTVVAGIYLNRRRTIFDAKSQRTVVVGGRQHTVLTLPIQYWSVVLVFQTLIDVAHRATR